MESPKTWNLNSLLQLIAICAILTVAKMTWETALKVEAIRAGQVTRAEVETQLADVRQRYTETQTRLNGIEARLAGLERRDK